MDRNLRNQHQMMSSANIPKRHLSHQHSHPPHMHQHAPQHHHQQQHHNPHHQQHLQHHQQQHHQHHQQQQQQHHQQHQQQQQHHQSSHHAAFNSSAANAGPTSGAQQNEDVIKYIEDAWHKVTSEHGPYGNVTRYYNHVPNPRLLANFQPFNLEDYWGQKVVRNLSHISRGQQHPQ